MPRYLASPSRFGIPAPAFILPPFQRYAIIVPPIGNPTNVRQSCPIRALREAPRRFTVRIPIANCRPHGLRVVNPKDAAAHAVPTPVISNTDNPSPILWNPIRAGGFSRQTNSIQPPRKMSAAMVTAQAVAPKAKNATSTFIPSGWDCVGVFFTQHNIRRRSLERMAAGVPAYDAGS
jgi:hypothetical protein